jgi:hypothetical protein
VQSEGTLEKFLFFLLNVNVTTAKVLWSPGMSVCLELIPDVVCLHEQLEVKIQKIEELQKLVRFLSSDSGQIFKQLSVLHIDPTHGIADLGASILAKFLKDSRCGWMSQIIILLMLA